MLTNEHDDSNCFASEYAKENPAEDWAETIATYRYNGLNLKNSCPSKYNYIKDNVFNGAEYTDLNSCSELPKEKLQVASKMFLDELQNGINLKKYSEDEVLQKCAHQFTRYPPIPSEMASCSLSMRFSEESSSVDSLVKKTLLASQIPVTEKNINDLLSSIKVNQELEKKILENTKGISEAIEKSLSSSIQNSLPIGMGKVTKDDPYWWAGDFKCDQKLMEMNKKELSNCLAKVMLDEDSIKQDYHAGKFPTYKVGTLFSDEAIESIKKLREQKLVQHLVEQPEFEEGLEKNISRFKVSLSLHQYLVSDTVSTLGKNLSPKEFCEKSYGVATDTFGFGIDAGTSFPKIQKWCEKIEATQPTRFKINPKDWDLMIETMLPK